MIPIMVWTIAWKIQVSGWLERKPRTDPLKCQVLMYLSWTSVKYGNHNSIIFFNFTDSVIALQQTKLTVSVFTD